MEIHSVQDYITLLEKLKELYTYTRVYLSRTWKKKLQVASGNLTDKKFVRGNADCRICTGGV